MARFGSTLAAHDGRGGTEGGDAGDILRAGTQAALLAAAANERIGKMNVFARPNERPDTFWPADLVGRERQEVGAKRVDIAGDAPGRLHRIDMQQSTRGMYDGGGLRDRLHHAGL